MPSTTTLSSLNRIGIDESGKGDYFGPLVIAAVFVTPASDQDLVLMQVRDSKKISDRTDSGNGARHSPGLSPQHRGHWPATLQRALHLDQKPESPSGLGTCPGARKSAPARDCDLAIADQFGDERLILNAPQEKGKQIRLVQRTKAEADLAVAAASILARAEFLLRLQRLYQELNTTLPKGASPAVELAGRMVVRKYGRDRLATVAKLHFKTTAHVLAES